MNTTEPQWVWRYIVWAEIHSTPCLITIQHCTRPQSWSTVWSIDVDAIIQFFFLISNVAFSCTLTCDGSVSFLNSSLKSKGNGAHERKRKETKSTDKAVVKFWVASYTLVLHSHSEVVIFLWVISTTCKFTCARSIKGKSSILSHDRCCRLWPLTIFYQIGSLKSVLY